MLLRREDVFAENHARVRHHPLESLNNRPLLGGRLHGVTAAHRHVEWSDDGVNHTTGFTKERLQSLSAIARVKRQAAVDGELPIGDAFNRFRHRKHAGGLADLLFVGAVRRDPLGDEPLLFFMKRELFGAVVTIAFLLALEIRPEAPVCLWWHVLRASLVGRDIEQHATALSHDAAPRGRWRRVGDGALSLVRKERLGNALTAGAIGVAALRALSDAIGAS